MSIVLMLRLYLRHCIVDRWPLVELYLLLRRVRLVELWVVGSCHVRLNILMRRVELRMWHPHPRLLVARWKDSWFLQKHCNALVKCRRIVVYTIVTLNKTALYRKLGTGERSG